MTSTTRTATLLAIGVLIASAALMLVGAGVGSTGFDSVLRAHEDPVAWQIVWDIRLPRTLGAWTAGALLGLAGAVAQGLFRNPAGRALSAGGSASGPPRWAWRWRWRCLGGHRLPPSGVVRLGLTGAAFLGAVLGVTLTLLLARGVQHTLRLLLAGVIVGVVLGAVRDLITLSIPEIQQAMQSFILGTRLCRWTSAWLMLAVWGLCMLLAWLMAHVLDGLMLGEATARSLGLPLASMRLALVGVLALASGTAVAQTGLIVFVGLAAPHLVRSIVKTHPWAADPAGQPDGRAAAAGRRRGGALGGRAARAAGGRAHRRAGRRLPAVADAPAPRRRWKRGAVMAAVALQAQDIRVRLGQAEVLHGIDLQIAQAQWTSIVGPNGAGKSTLLKALAHLLPHGGQVSLLGQPMAALSGRRRAQQMSWLGQNESSADDLLAHDVVMLGRLPHQAWLAPPSEADRQAVELACAPRRRGNGASVRWASSRVASASACCWPRAGRASPGAADGMSRWPTWTAAPGRLAGAGACAGGAGSHGGQRAA